MRRALLLSALAPLLLLAGCWDNRPIEIRSIVLVMGIDPAPGDRLKVTLQMPTPQSLEAVTGSNPPSGATSYTLAGEGSTVSEALDVAQSTTDHDIYIGQLQGVVLSTELSPRQFEQTTAFLSRFGPTDKSAFLMVTDKKASDILSFQPSAARFAALYLFTLFSCRECQVVHLKRLVWDEEKRSVSPIADGWLPVIDLAGNDFIVNRVAIYSGNSTVMTLTPDETISFGYLAGAASKATENVSTPWSEVGLRSVRADPKVSARLEGGRLVTNIDLGVTAAIVNMKIGEGTLQHVDLIEEALAQRVVGKTTSLIAKMQKEGLNPLHIGESLFWHHPELRSRAKTMFRDGLVRVSAHVKIQDVGDTV